MTDFYSTSPSSPVEAVVCSAISSVVFCSEPLPFNYLIIQILSRIPAVAVELQIKFAVLRPNINFICTPFRSIGLSLVEASRGSHSLSFTSCPKFLLLHQSCHRADPSENKSKVPVIFYICQSATMISTNNISLISLAVLFSLSSSSQFYSIMLPSWGQHQSYP